MISIVIPVHNEEQSLTALHNEIDAVLRRAGLEAEMIIVDDGSGDGSWNEVAKLARQDARVQGIRFRRNFGKAAALSAAFACVRGEFVVTLDADLQDNPSEIPRLIQQLDAGFDLVNGWKRRRFDPWHKVIPSRIFNWMIRLASGLNLHDHNCGLKGYRVEVVREIRIYGELHRFITLLAHARGFKVTELEVQHRPRLYGKSKYGVGRFVKGLLDLLTVRVVTLFGERPLHFLGVAGLFAFAAGFLGLAYLAWLWMMGHRPIGNRPVLIYSVVSLLLGAQMMTAGILAELIVSRLGGENGGFAQSYSIAERIGFR
ncbi:MAG: glycosyltransferase family 2 protein [Acidobacteria bacterium]|nr:glycosyltransferase family 2 protein [Acidobacteriota bacterium]MCI0625875.1 glycosyltransferase family 2 protein [Acidobacteriota bacterium]MCI0718159.1 glycosyltransferase family 2 protein [Acidobacteriota bacterium]